ncbi:hypothetical protein GCM10009677_57390 [Sphaerisporangium rubeum]|uniref:DUF3885 domain-containing protein n=1 Tax=Sphaerisporangium rubeum TaxID=321317 RepID=A0A7X0IFM0_9ACTN|nr:hypothetical protein [Sphaerisporangium rubeum]MBB6474344.1 hypothetical protein [Sphaerisporangium rubeum]
MLRAVTDDEISNVLLGPANLRWLYHPYDGGIDVILPPRPNVMPSGTDTVPG